MRPFPPPNSRPVARWSEIPIGGTVFVWTYSRNGWEPFRVLRVLDDSVVVQDGSKEVKLKRLDDLRV